jgi:glycosyltransferase involved in cell wall biosynthesis
MKIPCTVGILTFNNEKTLKRALDSVKDFAEIIICDGGSTDKTIEIAKSYGCAIIQQDSVYKYPDNRIADFSGVRNQILEVASFDWFLYIDSDEILSKEAEKEIRTIVEAGNSKFFVYQVPRKYIFNDKTIQFASTYPNYQVRFFNKKFVNSFIKKVHERIDPKKDVGISKIKNCIFVPHESDLPTMAKKYDYYLNIQLEKTKHLTFKIWFKWYFLFEIKGIVKGILKYILSFFSLKGKRLPFSIELLKWKFGLKLIAKSARKIFSKNV